MIRYMSRNDDDAVEHACNNHSGVPVLPPELLAQAERIATRHAEVGLVPFTRLVDLVTEDVGDGTQVTREQAEHVAAAAWGDRDRDAMEPDELPGWERLGDAFFELECAGLVAKENFSCCTGCGTSEISGYAEAETRGYVFYHVQDAESGWSYGNLCLVFGDHMRTDAGTIAIGHEIVAAVARAGLPVAWNGTAQQRITVGVDSGGSGSS